MQDYHDEIVNLANKCTFSDEENIPREFVYYCNLSGNMFRYDKRKIKENNKEIKELYEKVKPIFGSREIYEDEKLRDKMFLDSLTIFSLSATAKVCEAEAGSRFKNIGG